MPQIDPKRIVEDLRSEMSYAEMMKKYQLTFGELNSLFQRLISEGHLTASEVQERSSVEKTQQIIVLKCQSCGKLVFDESGECPECHGPLGPVDN